MAPIPQFGRLTEFGHRKVFGRIPFQRIRRQLLGREGRRGLDDDAFVTVEPRDRSLGKCGHLGRTQSIVGMTNSAPSLMPDGQRVVMVLVLV